MTTADQWGHRRPRAADPGEPLVLTAGPVALTVDGGTVRRITIRDVEVVRGIYGAVRDPGWGTIEPRFTTYEVLQGDGSFELRFDARCERMADGIDVTWTGTIGGTAEGAIRFEFDGLVRQPFLTARIGLCVLHPPRLAGRPVVVTTPFGRFSGRFPDLITSYMPFGNVTSMRYDAGSVHETVISFTGDLFETEDQRAFGDASFKTFGRPLELPWPYMVDAGTRVHQAVSVGFPRLERSRPRARRAVQPAHDAIVRIGDPTGRPFPPVGSAMPPADVDLTPPVLDAVREIGLVHLQATLLTAGPDTAIDLERAVAAALHAHTALDLVLVATPTDDSIEGVLEAVAAARVPVARVVAIDPARHTTPAALASRVRAALARAHLTAPLLGGSRGYLYQLIDQGVPFDLVDGAIFPMNPQVHASDERSIMETIEAWPAMIRTASTLVRGKPVSIGPLSMRALFDPDQVGPVPAPGPGELPGRYDRRQGEALVAAWTAGSVGELVAHGVASVTLHEAAGWAGLVAARHATLPAMPAPPGELLPVGRVARALAGMVGSPVLAIERPTGVGAIGVRRARGDDEVLVANLTPLPLSTRIARRAGETRVEIVEEIAGEGDVTLGVGEGGRQVLGLPACGVARLALAHDGRAG